MAKVWPAIFTVMGLFIFATASTAPAIFIFGDSLVDTGNNNYITTLSKGDIWFNGIDFGNGLPTGRFCNGRTIPDYICQMMGMPSPIPYLDPEANGRNILTGVNFASGGSGILPSTGKTYIGRIPFERQIDFFSNTKADLVSVMEQAENATHLISKALFYINVGSYDYISNYFLSQSTVSKLYNVKRYQKLLLSKFSDQLKSLYEMGARKFLVSNLIPLGCTPLLISSRNPDNGSCVHYINSIITNFNMGLENMLKNELQIELSDAHFVLSDNYAILSQVINNPTAFGFKYSNESCCGIGRLRAEFPCTPISRLCFHRADYVFWDAFHTTDALNYLLANLQYAGLPDFIRPLNLKDLMAIS